MRLSRRIFRTYDQRLTVKNKKLVTFKIPSNQRRLPPTPAFRSAESTSASPRAPRARGDRGKHRNELNTPNDLAAHARRRRRTNVGAQSRHSGGRTGSPGQR